MVDILLKKIFFGQIHPFILRHLKIILYLFIQEQLKW